MPVYSPEGIKTYLINIFWITVVWTIISVSHFFSIFFTLLSIDCNLMGMKPHVFFIGSVITGLLAGIVGGSFLVLAWEKWLRTIDYGKALFLIFLSYTLLYLFISFFTGSYFHSIRLEVGYFHPIVLQEVLENLVNPETLHSYIRWLIIVVGTLIFFQINDKYGPGVFIDFLLGKYFQPKKEQRIFMFLDLKSSTTIAETLGEEKYFHFLKDVLNKVTPSILSTKGRIYQYVGDEIVISWIPDQGRENVNCIRCFFAVKGTLKTADDYFMKTYGVIPEFKAGLHYGNVMVGEIGMVKRDIAYSGDVLNTTSRIQNKCNELGVEILFSQLLLEAIKIPPNTFSPRKIGDMFLKGKRKKVALYTV
ncbi:MAG: adenylate/guanylate cyclase domain-containing protein [Bacteroidota bacterium]